MKSNFILGTILAGAALAVTIPSAAVAGQSAKAARAAHAKQEAAKYKVAIQVSEGDPKKWNLALNNAMNVQDDFGKDNVDIEIVAYGPGLAMLKMDSEVANRVATAAGAGVKVVACENTMRAQKLSKDDMLPGIDYAKSGVSELMKKQREGYAYIRP